MLLILVLVTRYGQGVHIWDISFSTFNINYGKVRALSFSGISKLCLTVILMRSKGWRCFWHFLWNFYNAH